MDEWVNERAGGLRRENEMGDGEVRMATRRIQVEVVTDVVFQILL